MSTKPWNFPVNASSVVMAVFFALLVSGVATHASAATTFTPSSSQISIMRTCTSISHQIFDSSIIHEIRGGSSEDGGPSASDAPYNYVPPQQQQQPDQQPPQQTATYDQVGDPSFQSTPSASSISSSSTSTGEYFDAGGMMGATPTHEYSETVEGRIEAWRRQQQQLQQTRTAADAADVMDEQGTFKLFTTVSRASVSVFFFILMWRTVHHYELADAAFGRARTFRGALLRTLVVTPLVVLFLGEMMGALLGLTGGGIGSGSSSSHATKKRLKGILNLHKGVELFMMVYNVIRLAIWPSKYVTREVYIGRIISNFFFLIQAQLYTKLSWDEVSAVGEGGYVTESYYDDFTPEMMNNDGYSTEMPGVGNDFSQWQSPAGGSEYGGQGAPEQQQQYQQN